MKRDFLSIIDFSTDEIKATLELAKKLKQQAKKGRLEPLLKGKTLAMIFEKPSARTRVSFEVGMFQLGGHALYLGPNEVGIGKRESAADVARVLSRYCDGIMARLFGHEMIEELARSASVPVINGLTDLLHPCQVMGDVMTIMEHKGRMDGIKVAWIGDGNNVANSWLNMAARLPFTLHLACPEGYDPNPTIFARASTAGLSEVKLFRDPKEAVQGAQVIYTDVWASMGQEAEAEVRKKVFRPYQLNEALLKLAAPDCIVMHCLPAHRGDEITDEVIDGPHSVVFDEAENRLHVQKAIMVTLMRG
jgi:ornithine carbamoyltransferase